MNKRKHKRSFDLLSNYDYFAPGVKQLAILLLMMFIGIVLANLLTIGLYSITHNLSGPYMTLLSYPVMFIPAMLYASYQSHRNELFEKAVPMDENHFGKTGGFSVAIMAAAAAIAGNFVIDPLQEVLPPMSPRIRTALEAMMRMPVWVAALSTAVFAPFFEEWLCRGMILRGLLTKTRPVTAIVVSSLAFGLLHGNLQQGTAAFLLGLLFGFVYYKTGSLKLTMLMHCANNLFSLTIYHLSNAETTAATTFREVMPASLFYVTWAVCAVIVTAAIYTISRIPSAKDSSDLLSERN